MKLPEAFVQKMTTSLGLEAPAFFESLTKHSPVSVRLNPFKPTLKFSENFSIPWCKEGYYLEKRPSFTLDPLFHAGAYYVQEASSMIIGAIVQNYLTNHQVSCALDLCAAPGGKSTHLRSVLPDDALLVSNEVVMSRNFILGANMAKWGHPGTIITRTDPELIHSGEGLFDIVLVDAPCSGEGMFRKDPGAIEAWSPDAVVSCASRQKKILQTAASLVAPGGLLIYSTCTWSEEEDEQVVNGLLSQGAFDSFELPHYDGIVYNETGAKFFPHLIQGEGFFVAALIKTSGEKFISKKKIRLPSHINKVSSIDYCGNEFLQHPSTLLKADQALWCLPEIYFDRWIAINNIFNVVSSGCRYGEIVGKDVHPSPELALSILLNPSLNDVTVSDHEALRYLHGETLQVDPTLAGWQLVKFENYGLGWGKAVKGRLNNSYPKPWRIKMNIENTKLE